MWLRGSAGVRAVPESEMPPRASKLTAPRPNSPEGPFGAKGIGEVPLMATHAAISRAVAHALKRDVKSYPLSPDRVEEIVSH